MKFYIVLLLAVVAIASAFPRERRQVIEKTVITRTGPGFGGNSGFGGGPGFARPGFGGSGFGGPGFGRTPYGNTGFAGGPGFGRPGFGGPGFGNQQTVVKTTVIRHG